MRCGATVENDPRLIQFNLGCDVVRVVVCCLGAMSGGGNRVVRGAMSSRQGANMECEFTREQVEENGRPACVNWNTSACLFWMV